MKRRPVDVPPDFITFAGQLSSLVTIGYLVDVAYRTAGHAATGRAPASPAWLAHHSSLLPVNGADGAPVGCAIDLPVGRLMHPASAAREHGGVAALVAALWRRAVAAGIDGWDGHDRT